MEYNWLGVAFVSEDLPNAKEIEELVDKKADELKEAAEKEFEAFLDNLGLEQVMGIIVKKGSVK